MSGFQIASSPLNERSSSSADLLALLGVAFDFSAVAMILVDDALRVVGANPAATRMLAADPLVGRSLAEFGMTELVSSVRHRGFGELVEQHLECETEMTARSGHAVHAQVHLDSVVAPSGKRFFLAQFRDVTAERRQSHELADSELRYRQLVETLPDTSVMLFDQDLRLVLAAGEALSANGYDPHRLTGRLMTEVLPDAALQMLEPHYRDTLAGQSVNFEYDSPVLGRQFRVRTRPVTERTGSVIGGLVMSQDISADKAHLSQWTQAHQLDQLGSCWYDRLSGWTFDDELLQIWGADPAPEDSGFPTDLLPPEERDMTLLCWEKVISIGGRHTLSYRVLHGRTGQLRHLESTYETAVDADGAPLRVVATHLDVTDIVIARAEVQQDRTAAAADRLQVLLRVGDMLATSRLGHAELMNSIVNLSSAAIGDGAALRILTANHREVDRDVVAHPDDDIRRRFELSLQRTAGSPVPFDGPAAEAVGKGKLIAKTGKGSWLPEYHQAFKKVFFDETEHFMMAPLRHNGSVLGMLVVFRTDPHRPYRSGDDDVLQVLADGAGAAIAEIRARHAAERERDERLTDLREQQHELLEKLAGMEARERSQLAESIHDEPIQRLVAGMLRLDNLSIRMDEPTRDELDRVNGQLELAVDWLRNLIVVALSPPDLADGLGPALVGLANGIFAGTPTTFLVDGPDHVALTVAAKEAAYRIFREALVNVRKHARADTVTLQLQERHDVVVLSLIDDGIGSTRLDGGPGHLGMSTMRARADAEGGKLHIDSVPGLGTVVTLTLPAGTAIQYEGDSGGNRRGAKGGALS